jgi:hypothetical protein
MTGRMTALLVLFVLALASCSTSSDPSATFTGSACDYSGPSEFDVGSEVAFVYTNESETTSTGFAVWKFPEGLTSEQIFDQGIFNATNTTPGSAPWIGRVSAPTVIGTEYEFVVTFTETGQHGMVCFVFPGPETGSDWVTMFTVNG